MTLVVPEGTTVYGGRFSDTLGARHGLTTSSVTLNGGAPPGSFTAVEDPFNGFYQVNFSGAYTNAAGSGDDTFVFTMSAPVADVAANRRTSPNETLTNTGHFEWQDQDSTPHSLDPSVSTTIVEPNVNVTKDENDPDDRVEPGDMVTYTVTATNPSGTRVSTAHDLQLVDHVPVGLTPTEPIPGGGVWNSGARTITWTVASLAPNATAARTYQVTVDDPATAGSTFTNTVDLTVTSMAGSVSGERGPGSPITAGYVDDATDTLRLGEATLTKSVAPGSATIGDEVTYTTEVTFPPNVTYFDATVLDTLPDGMVYDDTVDVTCDGGNPCTPTATPLDAEPQPDGTTRLGWYLGDLPNQPVTRTYEITYTAYVADEYVPPAPVSDGDTLTNTAAAFYDGTDGPPPTSIPDPGDFSNGSDPDTADVDVVEPSIELDKDVSGDANDDDVRDTQPGDSYTYSITVHNDGTAPAYDLQVADTPDSARLSNIQLLPNPDANATDSDGSDGSLAWTIPGPIPVDGTVTLQYTADLAPSAQLSNGATVVNTADVPEFWGVPVAERDANPGRDYRSYDDVPEDTVTLDVHLPELSVVKTTGAAGFPDSARRPGRRVLRLARDGDRTRPPSPTRRTWTCATCSRPTGPTSRAAPASALAGRPSPTSSATPPATS